MSTLTPPTHAGQVVRNVETGKRGITTDAPAVRTPTISVQYVGGPYPVREQLAALTVTGYIA